MGPDLAYELRTAREDAGLTQQRVASHVGVTAVTVSRWERGVREPTLSQAQRFFRACGFRMKIEVAYE